jgi:hypothetical protein
MEYQTMVLSNYLAMRLNGISKYGTIKLSYYKIKFTKNVTRE